MSSVPVTWTFSTSPPKPFLAPSQRWLRPTLPCSWMTQMSFVTPASLSFLPAPSPAIVSVWPTCVMAPRADSSAPELSVTTGIFASTAVWTASLMASGFGAETARPSTPSVTAASIICACFSGSLLDSEYLSVTPMSLAACSAPFLATDQNDPPSPCVTMAIVTSFFCVRSTESLDASPPLSSSPPQPANTTAPTARTMNTNASRLMSQQPSLSAGEPASAGSRCSSAHR